MTVWLIVTCLILVGVLLLVAELVLLPGLSIAGIGALAAYGVAVWLGFTGSTANGFIVLGTVFAVSTVAAVISMRTRTWRRLALHSKVEGTSQPLPETRVRVGDRGVAATRLAPMGKVVIGNETYEAKSLGDKYVDQRVGVEVVGFENFSVIVKPVD